MAAAASTKSAAQRAPILRETPSMTLAALVGDPDAAALAREAIITSWTGEVPEPAYWIETAGFAQARSEIVAALQAGPGPIVLTGPSGHGKSLLLRSLWQQPFCFSTNDQLGILTG